MMHEGEPDPVEGDYLFFSINQMSKKSKKPIDPNAPKKNVSSYMHFCKEKRKQVKEDYPDLGTSEIGSKLGELWRALSDKDKTNYVKQAEADKTRYQTEMKSFEPTMT